MATDTTFIRARRNLLLDHAFFGSLVMHLEPKADAEAQRGMYTDGKTIAYNEEALTEMPLQQAAGLLAKEVMHCALGHHVRREDREPKLWQQACDIVTNPLIVDSGLQLPPGAVFERRFADHSAEQVYYALQQEQQKQQGGKGGKGQGKQQGGAQAPQGGQPGGQGKGQQQPGQQPAGPQAQPQGQQPQTGEVRDLPGQDPGQQAQPSEQSAAADDWKVRMQQALNNAEQRGEMPAGLARLIKRELQGQVSWREEMRKYMQRLAKDDQSWNSPNRRFAYLGIHLPTAKSVKIGPVIIAVDTSGSIGGHVLDVFGGEANAIIEDTQPEVTHVVYCDARVGRVDEYLPDDLPLKLQPVGGGGTRFEPVFAWIEQQGIEPACVIYLTDLEGSFPAVAPEYPVLWACVKPNGQAPFGDVLYIDPSQHR
jgi:predicted metal-dependent peptidase